MIQISKEDIKNLPIIKQVLAFLRSITFETLQGISLYDLIKHYFIGLLILFLVSLLAIATYWFFSTYQLAPKVQNVNQYSQSFPAYPNMSGPAKGAQRIPDEAHRPRQKAPAAKHPQRP